MADDAPVAERLAEGRRDEELPALERPARVYVVDPEGSSQFLVKFQQNLARFRLYRRRSLQVNTRFTAFSKSTRLSS